MRGENMGIGKVGRIRGIKWWYWGGIEYVILECVIGL